MATVKTPCVGVCSTGLGDSVCRGCKRYAHEVIHWNAYSGDERQAIMQRIESLLATVVAERIELIDPNRLQHQLAIHGVDVARESSDHQRVYVALKRFGGRLPNLEVIGCVARHDWANLSIAELKETIEDTFFELSCAHQQRYFPGHL